VIVMKKNNAMTGELKRHLMFGLILVMSTSVTGANDPNSFNRLMDPPSKRNPSPMTDGIHDPNNNGTQLLQPPKEAFQHLPKGKSGNYIDWMKALQDKKINPRNDKVDTKSQPIIMDLNIVREVKGSMPDVVYPHKQHTEWLDCANCHPAIFIPQKGANQISMASILLGEKCGVCHGKVAFPVSECRRCHSKPKPTKTANKKNKSNKQAK
jgi:c(7)-type cytochrome triheme protein